MKLCVIINPKAGSVKDFDLLRSKIEKLEPSHTHVTAEPGDAQAHAIEAIRTGCNYIVAAGGDGTRRSQPCRRRAPSGPSAEAYQRVSAEAGASLAPC